MGSGSSKDDRGEANSSRRQNIKKGGGREVPNSNTNTASSGATNQRTREEDMTKNTEQNNSWNERRKISQNNSSSQSQSITDNQRNNPTSERFNNNGNRSGENSNKPRNKQTTIEFVDSSDESDTDSILGVDDSWKNPLPNERQSSTQKQRSVQATENHPVLPPPPPSQPNHSIVFEQERALNEYNRQQGYNTGSVLKHPQISRLQQQTLENGENFPESYAHRLQRNQYRRDDTALLREKTIYRNPDEWQLEESIVQAFDANRFKAANQNKLPQEVTNPTQDSSRSFEDAKENQSSMFDHQQYIPAKRKGDPKYDDYDEQLMADIEKEFDL